MEDVDVKPLYTAEDVMTDPGLTGYLILAAFLFAESKAKEPMIPLGIADAWPPAGGGFNRSMADITTANRIGPAHRIASALVSGRCAQSGAVLT